MHELPDLSGLSVAQKGALILALSTAHRGYEALLRQGGGNRLF